MATLIGVDYKLIDVCFFCVQETEWFSSGPRHCFSKLLLIMKSSQSFKQIIIFKSVILWTVPYNCLYWTLVFIGTHTYTQSDDQKLLLPALPCGDSECTPAWKQPLKTLTLGLNSGFPKHNGPQSNISN